jgi:trimethylamine---corrinoid protein Co-methyltransferase
MCHRIIDGIDVNDETLALDVIYEIGPGNHFLSHEHTMKYFKKETWYPDLFKRKRYENWKNEGNKTLFKRTNEKIQRILDTHKPILLPVKMQNKINDLLKENKL